MKNLSKEQPNNLQKCRVENTNYFGVAIWAEEGVLSTYSGFHTTTGEYIYELSLEEMCDVKWESDTLDFLVRYIGGSQLYGLNTPESDVDWRGIYINKLPIQILGVNKTDSVSITEEGKDDEVYYELRRYFELLGKSNTQSIESLYVDESDLQIKSLLFDEIIKNKKSFINTSNLVNSTKGYAHGEYRLAMGERTGRLGGKRKEQLDRYGFSPKNVTQIIRISHGLKFFMDEGVYPLNLKNYMPEVFDLAYSVKTQPETFTKDQIDKICKDAIKIVGNTTDTLGWKFQQHKAVEFMRGAYSYHLS